MFIVDVQNIQASLDLKANSIAPTIPCFQHPHLSAGFLSGRLADRLTDSVVKSKSKSHCDWRSVSQLVLVSIFITVWQLQSCFCGAPSLTRGRVCLLYMLLPLTSAVFLGSESLGTRDHILLSLIRDFPFRRLFSLVNSNSTVQLVTDRRSQCDFDFDFDLTTESVCRSDSRPERKPAERCAT
jgi:hypothetical protein